MWPMRLSRERFETLVDRAAEAILSKLPPDLRDEAEQVYLEIADWPTPEQQRLLADGEDGMLLGLYEGVPLVERRADSIPLQPDRITLFQRPIESVCRTEAELRWQIRKTLIHELGHYFGFDEDELHDRGWG